MWLRKGETVTLVPASMPDTIARCLGDGWVEVPDPTLQAAPEPEPAPMPAEVVEVLAEAALAEIHERNDAARAAFGEAPRNRHSRGRGR